MQRLYNVWIFDTLLECIRQGTRLVSTDASHIFFIFLPTAYCVLPIPKNHPIGNSFSSIAPKGSLCENAFGRGSSNFLSNHRLEKFGMWGVIKSAGGSLQLKRRVTGQHVRWILGARHCLPAEAGLVWNIPIGYRKSTPCRDAQTGRLYARLTRNTKDIQF